MKKRRNLNDLNRKRLEVLQWANEHDFIIDPFGGMDFHIEGFFETGWCPCDKTRTRLKCPCDESLVDVLNRGHCLCQLFWTRQEALARVKKYIKSREELDAEELARATSEQDLLTLLFATLLTGSHWGRVKGTLPWARGAKRQ